MAQFIVIILSRCLNHQFLLEHRVGDSCLTQQVVLQGVDVGSLRLNSSFLEAIVLHLVLLLEIELSIEASFGPIARLSEAWKGSFTKSLLLWDKSWHILFLLEVSKSASKVGFGAESSWSNQLWIGIWLETLPNCLNRVLNIVLFIKLLGQISSVWMQVWEISIILWNFDQVFRHTWGKNFTELWKVQVAVIILIDKLHHWCNFCLGSLNLDRL